MKAVCLAILNYNGIHHLECLLPTVSAAMRAYPGPCRAIVLDNQSTQGDVQWIHSYYRDIEVVSSPTNDYLFSYNWLLPQLTEEVVVLLNNDVRLTPGLLPAMLRHFVRDDVFAVSATSLDWTGTAYTCGPASLTSRHGWYSWGYDTRCQELKHTLFASGGFSAVCRRKFIELEGFSRIFFPAYCEDLDLCFRAWRRGWRSIFEPASKVFHRDHGSWDAGPCGTAPQLAFRNQLLFTWLTLPPSAAALRRFAMVMWVLGLNWRYGRRWCVKVWCDAVRTWWKLKKRYRGMRVTKQELNALQHRINQAITLPT